MESQKNITFSLNGKQVKAQTEETIWEVAKRTGTDIPHLCYSPEPGYRADGNCRACMVEIEGERVLAASCIRTPTEGMVVNTETDRAQIARKGVFELLLALKVLAVVPRHWSGIQPLPLSGNAGGRSQPPRHARISRRVY